MRVPCALRFIGSRQAVLRRVADMLNARLVEACGGALSPHWFIFGSSANGFGKESSDVDLSLVWTRKDTYVQDLPHVIYIGAAVLLLAPSCFVK